MQKTVTAILVLCLVVGTIPATAVPGGGDRAATADRTGGERADRPLAAAGVQPANNTTTARSDSETTTTSVWSENATLPSSEQSDDATADGRSGSDATATAQSGDATTVTVLSYNDIQTAAAEDRNFSRLVTLVNRRRAAHANPTVVVGAGDEIGPHALSPVSSWRAPVEVLNSFDPAAETIGNHEFDYGLGEVSNVTAASEFPWLATNLVDAETGEAFDGTESYEVVERDGTRIGIVGLLDRSAAYGKTNIDFADEGLKLQNFTRVGARTASTLKQERNVDVVVALAHTGIPQAKRLANASDAIDVIAVGDDEVKFPPREVSGTVVTESVARAQYLSEINLTVSDGEVTRWNGRLVEVTDRIPKNGTASRIITRYREGAKLDTVVAYSEVPLNATFAANYHRETNYGNLVTDAMRAATDADVAVTNAGGIRSDSVYGPGNITGGDVFNTLPFSNTVVSVELTGRELRRTLASQVVTVGSPAGQKYGAEISQQVSGVRFEWIPHNGTRKIEDVYVNRAGPDAPADWTRLDANATYEVAVNSYMKGGGDGYPLENASVADETGELLAETVIDYMEAKRTVSPAVEGRMRRVDAEMGYNEPLSLDREGNVTIAVPVPDGYEEFVPGTFRMVAPGIGSNSSESVAPESVEYDSATGSLVVTFADADLVSLTDGRSEVELDLYGGYESSAYEQVYFDHSVLNVDVYASVLGRSDQSAEATTESPDGTPESPETATETSETVTASPETAAESPATPAPPETTVQEPQASRELDELVDRFFGATNSSTATGKAERPAEP